MKRTSGFGAGRPKQAGKRIATQATKPQSAPAAELERHWLEYPNGIPVESWGKDHLSTLVYAETRAVDYGGKLDDRHMRVGREYPTRLHNGVTVAGHTDYDCLRDAQFAGFLQHGDIEGGNKVVFTDAGWDFVHKLRRKRAG